VILIILVHSLMDYPLRTFGLLTAFAFANAALFPKLDLDSIRRRGSHPAPTPPLAFSTNVSDE
jgi:hypothetical protein